MDGGPRNQGPHAPRIILGPFGMTPRAPKPLHVQLKVQYRSIAWCLRLGDHNNTKKIVPKEFKLRKRKQGYIN